MSSSVDDTELSGAEDRVREDLVGLTDVNLGSVAVMRGANASNLTLTSLLSVSPTASVASA